jgi:hypothetical protein
MTQPRRNHLALAAAHDGGLPIRAAVGQGDLLDTCARLGRDLCDSYYIQVDGRDPSRRPRYIAIARSLEIRPYAVVTADPVELYLALSGRPAADLTAGSQPGA